MSSDKILIAFDDKCSGGDLNSAVEATVEEWTAIQKSTGTSKNVIDASLAEFSLLDELQERDPAVVTMSEFQTIPRRIALV